MDKSLDLFYNAIEEWRLNKGIGTAIIPKMFDDKVLVLCLLQRFYSQANKLATTIITDSFASRQNIIDFITKQNDEENNKEFKELLSNNFIKVVTANILDKVSLKIPHLCIVYRCNEWTNKLNNFVSNVKFKLIILNKLLTDNKQMSELYKVSPILKAFKQSEIDLVRTSTPVEEIQIGISIDDNTEEYKLLQYYNEYISTSISIFGSFDILQQARVGNTKLNISATQICEDISKENGWNPHLDMSVEYNRQIDELYNPINLNERSTKTYEIIRNRSELLSNYIDKLYEIERIVNDNPTAKILIINKKADFATEITNYLNSKFNSHICECYHDKLESIPAVDINGTPLYYKSGNKAGERKYLAAKGQKTLNQSLFNNGKIRVLATNNLPDKDLNIKVDIVIITSPQCESIENYLYRLSYIQFNDICKLYTLYIKATQEEKMLQSKPLSKTHKIVNNCENVAVNIDNDDFVIVD